MAYGKKQKVKQVNPQSPYINTLGEKLKLEKNKLIIVKTRSKEAVVKDTVKAEAKAEVKDEEYESEESVDEDPDISKNNTDSFEVKTIRKNPQIVESNIITTKKLTNLEPEKKQSIDSVVLKQIQKNMLHVKSGCFDMGKSSDEFAFSFFNNASVKGYGKSSENFNNTKHQVCLTRDFLISRFEVTQKVWTAVMNNNPSQFHSCGGNCPVERVSWREVQQFIKRLNKNSSLVFRLPTEAEWEYIAQAGKTETEHTSVFGNNYSNNQTKHQCRSNSTSPVGVKKANAWGIYDVYGNVWEWVSDWYGNYPKYKVMDPLGPGSGAKRVIRGGSWLNTSKECNSYVRKASPPYSREGYIGFRLAADIK